MSSQRETGIRPRQSGAHNVASIESASNCHRWGLILAGGDGTRLLPLTRSITGDDRPKQFCTVMGNETLLQQTQRRISKLIPAWRTMLVLTAKHEPFYAAAVAGIPTARLVIQPASRGTAPAILNTMLRVRAMDYKAIVACFPSDHHFSDDAIFVRHMESAYAAAASHPDTVVLLGIPPKTPEVEYGWIEPGIPMRGPKAQSVCRVTRFWEKPTAPIASQLMANGCLWNSFVMVGHVQTFVDLVRHALPWMSEAFEGTRRSLFTAGESEAFSELYSGIRNTCFSQHVLSVQPDRLAVLHAPGLGWSDLGEPGRVRSVLEGRVIRTGRLEGKDAWPPRSELDDREQGRGDARVTQLQLEGLKMKLETSQKDLRGSLQNRGRIAVERTPDLTDAADLAGERDIAMWSLDSNSVQLRLVKEALARAADGTYGCCLNCEEQISLKRLAALPHAILCVTCQQEEDQGRINLGGYCETGSLDSAPGKHKRRSLGTQSAANA